VKVFITGGTGFIGTCLAKDFLKKGHSVTATGTRPRQTVIEHPEFFYVAADTSLPGAWQQSVEDADVVINLAGKSIFKRWSKSYKEQIRDSRILTTRHLVAVLPPDRPVVLFSASAVGYYGNRDEDLITENEPPAGDFLGQVSLDWEQEASAAANKGHRVVLMRFGVVFGKGGGAFKQMVAVFKRFTGGPIGDGRQWFPWIHIRDLAGAVQYILGKKHLDGPFNFCAPNPLRNREVAKAFGNVLKRPSGLRAPPFMLRLVLGEFADTLLASQRALPDRLLQDGFVFRFPRLDGALADLA